MFRIRARGDEQVEKNPIRVLFFFCSWDNVKSVIFFFNPSLSVCFGVVIFAFRWYMWDQGQEVPLKEEAPVAVVVQPIAAALKSKVRSKGGGDTIAVGGPRLPFGCRQLVQSVGVRVGPLCAVVTITRAEFYYLWFM